MLILKNLNYLNEHRINLIGDLGDECNGIFEMKIKGETYRIVASDGHDWEHVSISCKSSKTKIPSWTVMCIVKDLFFNENEVVMQLHPPKRDYVNNVSNCLHLWKPTKQELPTPPHWMVGIKGLELR